jgi:hypothetical protein
MSVSCECCVLSGKVLCVGLITRPGSPTVCGVSECDREATLRGGDDPVLDQAPHETKGDYMEHSVS